MQIYIYLQSWDLYVKISVRLHQAHCNIKGFKKAMTQDRQSHHVGFYEENHPKACRISNEMVLCALQTNFLWL